MENPIEIDDSSDDSSSTEPMITSEKMLVPTEKPKSNEPIITLDKKLEETDKPKSTEPIITPDINLEQTDEPKSTEPIITPDIKLEQTDKLKRSIISRPGVGTSGHPISLQANHFKALVNLPDEVFYQYNVSISSEDKIEIESKGIGRKVIAKLWQTYESDLAGKRFAYDGQKALYTVGPLPHNNFEFTVVIEHTVAKCTSPSKTRSPGKSGKRAKKYLHSRIFSVAISYAAKIPLRSISVALQGDDNKNVQDALRVLDIVLRQYAADRGFFLVGQSFFQDDSRLCTDIGGGISVCRGFHSSFRPTHEGLFLNMDVSTTLFLTPGPVINFLLANQNVKEPRYIDWTKANKMLKNMRVKALHNNREFKIIGLSEKPCNQQLFSLKVEKGIGPQDGVETTDISVYEYFVKHRNIELKSSAYMPCLNVGKPKRPNYLPIELSSLLPLQRYKKVLSSLQRASVIEKSRQKPQERIRVISDAMKKYQYDKDPLLAACGISIEKQLTHVEGRVLEAPKLKVGKNEDCIPCNGRWNFKQKQVLTAFKIETWAVVNFSSNCDTSHFTRELIDCGKIKGIHIERPYSLIEEDPQYRKAGPAVRVEKMYEQIMAKLPGYPQFILCVLPERKNCEIYGPWKKKSLCDLGIVTQCISPLKVTDQYLTNVLLKINSKLGGINSLLALEQSSCIPVVKDAPTMILGMDVSHGSPGRSDIPSIAAVVGSRSWPFISRYRAAVRTQSSKLEMIDSLYKPLANGEDGGIMRELLWEFYDSSKGCKPSQIIVFRDGVSESQFPQVLNVELDQMIKAYKHLGEVDFPKFTVIVAQKNHHSRIFKSNAPENVPAGTVVDTKIVHPKNYDFFMCAQAGMIGTSRPAHYHVLYDEIGFSTDDLQNLIHALSYVNQRSTTAASIVAPICYAHLAAQQMGQFIKFDDLSEISTTAGVVAIPVLPRLHKEVESSMFFC